MRLPLFLDKLRQSRDFRKLFSEGGVGLSLYFRFGEGRAQARFLNEASIPRVCPSTQYDMLVSCGC